MTNHINISYQNSEFNTNTSYLEQEYIQLQVTYLELLIRIPYLSKIKNKATHNKDEHLIFLIRLLSINTPFNNTLEKYQLHDRT